MECWGLQARSTELLLILSSHPVDLICIQDSNLILSSSFRIPGFSALRSGLVFFLLMSHTLAAASSFLSGRAYPSLNFLFPLFLRFSDYVGVNISLNYSPRSHSLMFMFLLFALRWITEPISFLPPSFPAPKISLFWGISIAITPSGTQKVLLTPVGRKYSIGSFLLPPPSQ